MGFAAGGGLDPGDQALIPAGHVGGDVFHGPGAGDAGLLQAVTAKLVEEGFPLADLFLQPIEKF